MRFQEIKQSLWDRVRNPAYWVVLLSLWALSFTFMLMVVPKAKLGNFLGLQAFALLWLPAIFLSPVPWQWTQDDRPLAPWGRGLLQVFGFGLLLVLLHALAILIFRGQGEGPFILGLVTGIAMVVLMALAPLGIMIARGERLAQETREAKTQARQAQWMSHRGAFSPRLLFGNLDHLADLAQFDPRGTEQGLVDLAALYRHWLVEAEKPVIPLSTELGMAEEYLALEQKRWKGRLRVRTQFDLEQDSQAVPPLLLLSFLEQTLTGSPKEHDTELSLRVSGTASMLEIELELLGSIAPPSPELLLQFRRRILATLNREAITAINLFATGWKLTLSIPKGSLEILPC